MSKGSLANLTTPPLENSFESVYIFHLLTSSNNEKCNWEVEGKAPSIRLSTDSRSSQPDPDSTTAEPIKVSYLTEQTSHHPPVSAFYVDCPLKGITARGFDQISAKFTGTSIRVTPGQHNLGIFVTLQKRDNEEYQLTHPAAHLGGLLRGSLAVTVVDICYVTCPKTGMKAMLHYVEEGWLGRTQNKVQGVIFRYDPENDSKIKIKDVPEKDILARIEGCWQEQVYFTLAGSTVRTLLSPISANSFVSICI
jgi:oxysterol-binding protein-related protein 9/10/11